MRTVNEKKARRREKENDQKNTSYYSYFHGIVQSENQKKGDQKNISHYSYFNGVICYSVVANLLMLLEIYLNR